jgi:hypothetical protein
MALSSTFVFIGKDDNKVFCTMQRFAGALNDLLTAAFASGIQGMVITDYPDAQRGDVWNGTGFTKMSDTVGPETGERIGLLVDNELVDILELDPAYPYYDNWINGFSKEHFGLNATGMMNARSGSTWDGESFTLAE